MIEHYIILHKSGKFREITDHMKKHNLSLEQIDFVIERSAKAILKDLKFSIEIGNSVFAEVPHPSVFFATGDGPTIFV